MTTTDPTDTTTDATDAPVALITGGTQGIGRACAEELVQRGYRLVVTGRSPDSLAQAVAELASHGGTVHGVLGDVSVARDAEAVVAEVGRLLGRLDVLVINSGGPPKGPFTALDDEQWVAGIDEVLLGAIRHVRQALPLLQASPRGRIIVIGSTSVRRPIPHLTVSNVLRPALAGLVATLAVELGPSGVTVNMVAPGRTDTARLLATDTATAGRRGLAVEEVRAEAAAAIPFGRNARVEEVAATIGMLASEEASYVTGQCLLVDGGLTLGSPWV